MDNSTMAEVYDAPHSHAYTDDGTLSPPSTPPAERPFNLPETYQVQSVIGEGAYGVVW